MANGVIANRDVSSIKNKSRLLMLIAALERNGIAPTSMKRLHAFAYLADILSPVWGLTPFEDSILKLRDGPHYADLQKELDRLVVMGLVTVFDLTYVPVGKSGARIDGQYQLRFESESLPDILSQLGVNQPSDALDPRDVTRNSYLVELAAALATLPNDEIDVAASVDATYASQKYDFSNVIEIYRNDSDGVFNDSVDITNRFSDFIPQESRFSAGEKVFLYATYLGKKIAING